MLRGISSRPRCPHAKRSGKMKRGTKGGIITASNFNSLDFNDGIRSSGCQHFEPIEIPNSIEYFHPRDATGT